MTINKDIFMLCNSIQEDEAVTLNEQRYQANYKFDGERIIAVVMDGDVILMNRRGKICNIHFREVVEDLKKLPNCIIDGEIISFDDDFNKLMRRAGTQKLHKIKELEVLIPVKMMVFDCLKVGDNDIRNISLYSRIEELQKLFLGLSFTNVELAEYKPIKEMLELAKAQDKEGIIVKDIQGIYESKRSNYWKKLKFFLEGTIKAVKYEENPKGLTLEDGDGNRVACLGSQAEEVKRILDSTGEVEVYIQYLEKTKENRYRFPSYRGLVVK